jgi:AP-4 complex subunit epsilon-1
MLGHSAPFAHIHAINLTQNKSLILKKIGYFLCSVFFNKDSELLIMLVSTILKDLSSTDVHEVVICLTALGILFHYLGNIMNNTIASGIIESVLKLTVHTTDLVRKKALLILQKIVNHPLPLEKSNRCLSSRLQIKTQERPVRSRTKCNGSNSKSLL